MSRLFVRRVVAAALTTTAVLGAAPVAAQAEAAATDCSYVADRAGDDAAAGTPAAPFKSVRRLAQALGAGQTGCLRGGVYTESVNGIAAYVTKPGATLRSHPGERARVVGSIAVMSDAAGARIAGLELEGLGVQNTLKVYAPDVVVEDNLITTARRGFSCLVLGSPSAGRATRAVVRRNVLRECGSAVNGNKDHAIYAANIADGQIVDNVIIDPAAYAVQLYPNAQTTRVAHNVIDGGSSVRGGIVIGSDPASTSNGNVVEDNVIAFAAAYGVSGSWEGAVGSGNVARDNCVFQTGWGTITDDVDAGGNVVADPQFADRAAGDLRLRAGSKCLDVVGYDSAARLAGTTSAPAVSAGPAPAPQAGSTPAPAAGASTAGVAPAAAHALPWIKLLRPRLGRKRTVHVTAKAPAEVRAVRFYVSGKLRATDTAAPFKRTLRLAGRRVAVRLTARAVDAGGRTASSTVTLRRLAR